jgi:hypothetical protein
MKLRSISSLAICSLALWVAACGDDDGGGGDGDRADAMPPADAAGEPDSGGGTPDAMTADLSCIDGEIPAEAPNTITVSGQVVAIDIGGQEPIEGAIVQLRRASNDRILDDNAPGGTPADGSYSLTGRTRGVPLEGYLHATADGSVTTRLYPPLPIYFDLPMVPVPMFSPLIVSLISPDQEPENGIIVLLVLDCVGQPIQGATVTSTPEAGDIIYGDQNGLPDEAATSTGAQGNAFLVNVPAGAVAVNAMSGEQALYEHTVVSVPDEVVTTVVLPGPPAL